MEWIEDEAAWRGRLFIPTFILLFDSPCTLHTLQKKGKRRNVEYNTIHTYPSNYHDWTGIPNEKSYQGSNEGKREREREDGVGRVPCIWVFNPSEGGREGRLLPALFILFISSFSLEKLLFRVPLSKSKVKKRESFHKRMWNEKGESELNKTLIR